MNIKKPDIDHSMIGTKWLHIKSNNVYSVVGFCIIESTWQLGVLYEGENSLPIVRDYAEFTDGRFQQLTFHKIEGRS